MRFYFVRHGETEYNDRKIAAGGSINCQLTLKGKEQAKFLKEKIESLSIKAVVSSPLIRAKQTAEIIWSKEFIIEENLKEIDLGSFSGLLI